MSEDIADRVNGFLYHWIIGPDKPKEVTIGYDELDFLAGLLKEGDQPTHVRLEPPYSSKEIKIPHAVKKVEYSGGVFSISYDPIPSGQLEATEDEALFKMEIKSVEGIECIAKKEPHKVVLDVTVRSNNNQTLTIRRLYDCNY